VRIRTVRFSKSFFESLDSQLPENRQPDGTPSSTDFLLFDLPTVRDRLALDLESCTIRIQPGDKIRLFVGAGTLVQHFALFVTLTSPDVIEVLDIEISLD
jgi:hypothetical protein